MPGIRTGVLSLICAVAFVAGGAAVLPAQGLPGGASSLNETHADWTVNCGFPQGSLYCAISQTQVDSESRHRVLAVELTVAEGAELAASGMLIMPFGLELDEGVSLAIDTGAPFQTLSFSTCLPTGCLVPMTLEPDAIRAMQSGGTLKIGAIASGTNQNIDFSISLSGFASALERVGELSAP